MEHELADKLKKQRRRSEAESSSKSNLAEHLLRPGSRSPAPPERGMRGRAASSDSLSTNGSDERSLDLAISQSLKRKELMRLRRTTTASSTVSAPIDTGAHSTLETHTIEGPSQVYHYSGGKDDQLETDSSSDEEDELSMPDEREESGGPSLLDDIDATAPAAADFADFQAEFETSYQEEEVEEYVPPTFAVAELEQRPEEPVDLAPIEHPPRRQKPEIYMQSKTLLSNISYCKPTTNPLTGNVICCRTKKNKVVIQEMELSTGIEVACTEVLDRDMQRKIMAVYGSSAISVNKILHLAAGLHKPPGQTRVRLCALIEFEILTPLGTLQPQVSLALWQWGYASVSQKPIALQSLLTPPNHADFTYQASSLQMADGLVFLAGYAQRKGPCVFVARPTVRDTWAANFLGQSTSSISCLAVTNEASRLHKLLAVAMQDGSLSVWTYEAAVDRKGGKEETKVILPLCRLESTIKTQPPTRLSGDGHIKGGAIVQDHEDALHFCTHLEWKTPDSSYSSLLYLAAAYTDGIAVFHVELPLLVDTTPLSDAVSEVTFGGSHRQIRQPISRSLPEPKTSTQLAQTVILQPFCAARWSTPSDWCGVSWIDLGPHTPPTLALFLEEEDVAAACVLGTIDLEDEGRFQVLCEHFLAQPTGCLLSSSSIGSVLCYCNNKLEALTPSVSSDSSFFESLRHPISVAPPGLDSAGYVSSSAYKDGMLHVYTVSQCERRISNLSSMVPKYGRLDWSRPIQRHYLVRSFVGDQKEAQETIDGDVTGGSYANVVCELSFAQGMVPHRIVKCNDSPLCAVLFRSSITRDISLDAEDIQVYDTSNGKIVESREGRDIVFLSGSKAGEERAIVLAGDGTMIYLLTRRPNPVDVDDKGVVPTAIHFEDGIPFRPLLGFDGDHTYIDCRRILAVSSGSEVGIIVVGRRVSDGQVCLVAGNREPIQDNMHRLIPHVKDGCLWLRHGEEVLSLSELPQYEEGRHCIAVATQSRVLLVSSGRLNIRAEISCKLSSSNLASIGSHTVAFISSDHKVRYLCCLDGNFRKGIIATLPVPRFGCAAYMLMALRPERFLYAQYNSGSRLVEQGENKNSFLLPTCITRPAFLLEPIVANALCEADNPGESTILLRAVIERFGRKISPFPHGDDEGVGINGTGLTQQVMEMLSAYGLKHPASWLLTGSIRFERSSHSKILPSWMPMSIKSVAALNADAQLHVLSNGDQYFTDYIKSPEENMVSTLPRVSDPSSVFSRELAKQAMARGDIAGALKLFDLAGTVSSENAILHLILAMQLDPFADVTPALRALSGVGEDGRSSFTTSSTASAIAALAVELKLQQQQGMGKTQNGQIPRASDEFRRRWMRQLAPSTQRHLRSQRARHRLLGEDAIDKLVTRKLESADQDTKWNNPCNETKHVWSEGPFKDKENILLLACMEDWLGRRRPAVLGKEGAAIALERGETTLADILNRANDYDDDSFGAAENDAASSSGWVEGIGEGRTDEDNLSAYFRMSEGADEDSAWRADGLADLTRYHNKIKIIGQDIVKLQETTSSVDEGEPGKVKLLYDIVFEEPQDDIPAGFLMEVPRGSSCDVGILHGPIHDGRKRCTVEFWFHVPMAEDIVEEIILARRCVTNDGDDLSKLCIATHRESTLWELALLPTGELEFRTSGGTVLNSTDGVEDDADFGAKGTDMMGDFGGDDDDIVTDAGPTGEVSWQRPDGGGGWNHVCLLFTSKSHEDMTECTVTMLMKGYRVASILARIVPPGLEGNELEDSTAIDGVLARSVILFGLNPVGNLRFTEMRIWSCVRKESDIKMMMYEYLRAAETKKKFKVKIRSKKGESENLPTTGKSLLAPPKSGMGRLGPPRSKDNSVVDAERPRGLLPPPRSRRDEEEKDKFQSSGENEDLFAFIPPLDMSSPKEEEQKQRKKLAPPHQVGRGPIVDSSGFPMLSKSKSEVPGTSPAWKSSPDWEDTALSFPNDVPPPPSPAETPTSKKKRDSKSRRQKSETGASIDTSDFPSGDVVKDSAPLSKQVRSSAAAALVRGPPATRHFGGNRGGLASTETGRFGVGSIAICGQEKTVVYKYERHPPGKIYPIGASGAIISDEMDSEGSEYLCCFLAKDKRMVVFELTTKTVVVELQMTTKLNFWRYLPPQTHGNTLVFMLITPVGGFHWMPLDESPRPRQVWKRGQDLQGKKIVAYEEGGSNGMAGPDARSVVAVLLVSQASSGTPLEAWLMPISGDSRPACVSSDVLGAGLFRPQQLSGAFLPYLVTADKMNEDIILEIQPLVDSLAASSFGVGDVLTCAVMDQKKVGKVNHGPPTLAMGSWPEVLICCHDNFVVATIRRKGLMVAYEFKRGDLEVLRQEALGSYVVDAAIRPGANKNEIEVVLLLTHNDNPRDGRVISLNIGYSAP